MMEIWTSYQTRAIHAETQLKEEKERLARHREELETRTSSLEARVVAAEKAETRVKDHLRNARQEKIG